MKLLKIIQWILAISFLLMSFVTGSFFSSVVVFIAGILMMPIKPVRDFLVKIRINGVLAVVLSFVLLFVGVIVSPESEEPNLPVDSDVKVEVNSEVYVDKKLEESSTSEEFIVEENTTELINEGNSEETTFEQSTTQTTVEHTIKPNTVVTPSRDENQENKYVLNTSTKKFHRVSCRHVKDIKESNYSAYEGARNDVINMGYKPCGHCHP